MPNLVGIGLSQVPTNGMLGGLAYQDPEHASIKNLDLKNLSQINSEIADTAVDVFVYDTRKDSDGGAWRKRTQHTSWYNEILNTSIRGSRKEFPAVAVIVAENTSITIYDGDDPDLPMWMVFNTVNGMINTNSNNLSSVSMLNGILVWTSFRSGIISFIPETAELLEAGYAYGLRYGLVNRNISGGWNVVTGRQIINNTCNDVAMTVLPNAPIDSATGLPIPTIAVATNGGTSVIKDDGTVVDFNDALGSTRPVSTVAIRGNDIVHWNVNNGTLQQFFDALNETSDSTNDVKYNYTAGGGHSTCENVSPLLRNSGNGPYYLAVRDSKSIAAAAQSGMSVFVDGIDRSFSTNTRTISDSRVAYVTSDYNTGWMHGDIKGAFMSDTDTTDAVAAYSDGFSNNNKGWSFADNGSSGISGGNLVIEQNSNARATDSDALNGVATGTKLTFTLTVSGSGNGNLLLDDDGAGAGVGGNTNYGLINATGSYTFTANKTASNRLRFVRSTGSNNYDVNFLNITTEYDRSVNNKGLQVFGTVTKSAVATGADLVAYSGFSGSNFLKHLYNSELAPGTAAYSVSCWFKTGTSSGDQYIFDRNGGGSGSRNLLLIMNTSAGGGSDSKFQFWHRDNFGNVTDIQITDKTITDNVWHQVVALNDGSTYKVYVDGEVSSVTSSQIRNVISDNDPPMFIGIRHTEGSTFMTGSMALFRYSKSAPSPEQIKKMYEDEKCLFHENAKATLYGSSDAVTALAFDDTTNLLHVGTSAGRSEFQGLSRINNTTDAVTTAISASNGLVAEQ